MALAMLAFGYNELSLLDWFPGGAAGVVAYCVVLLLIGEVTRSKLGAVRRAVAARFG